VLTGAGLGEYLAQLFVPVVLAALSVSFGFICVISIEGDVARLVWGALAAGAVYLASSSVFNKAWFFYVKELFGVRGRVG